MTPAFEAEFVATKDRAPQVVAGAGTAFTGTKKRPNRLLPVAIVAAVGLVGVLIYNGVLSPSARLDAALKAGRLIGRGSVLEIYSAWRASAGDSEPVRQAAAKIRAALQPPTEAALVSWYRDSTPPDWAYIVAASAVLSEVDPVNREFAARRAYAEAQQRFEARDFPGAWRMYDVALQTSPGWVLPLNGKAKILIRTDSSLHDPRAGVAMFKQAIAADPNFVWAYKNLGEYYRQERDWVNARAYLGEADRRSPGRPSIRQALDDANRMYEQSLRRTRRR